MKKTQTLRPAILILFLVCSFALAVFLRWLVVRHDNFPFWFDVARDATISREIVEQHHLKLQGPNASGTKDTVFHGVLYYYLIGPLYTLFHGDPQWVVIALGAFTALAIIPVYFLAEELTESSIVGMLAVVLYVFSYDAIRAGTWLSNPVIAAVAVPCFLYFLWKTFFQNADSKNSEYQKNRHTYLWLLSLTLGICTQSVIFLVTLWGEVFVAYWWLKWQQQKIPSKNTTLFSFKEWVVAGAIYLASVSTMILTELRMIHSGLLNVHTFAEFSFSSMDGVTAVTGAAEQYLRKMIEVGWPSLPVGSVIILLIASVAFFKKSKPHVRAFLLIALTGPLWLFSWLYRDMYHLFIGLEALTSILLAWWLVRLWQDRTARGWLGKFCAVTLFILYIFSNARSWQLEQQQRLTPYFLPQGAYLRDQLALIDETYTLSHGQPFSISTLTNPYGYNVTWAYLYAWYGQQKYGHMPTFVGPDQTGLFGANLLPEMTVAQATAVSEKSATTHYTGTLSHQLHFTIYEPPEGIPDYLKASFAAEQNAATGTPSATEKFGSLTLEVHEK